MVDLRPLTDGPEQSGANPPGARTSSRVVIVATYHHPDVDVLFKR